MPTENQPLVTVICNCYNHELYILETLNSVINQSYTNIELIVINNGSSDNSAQVISEFVSRYPNVNFINSTEINSHTVVFNQAFKKSAGDFLIDLSGDDRLLQNCVENQVDFFLKQKEDVGIVFGNAIIIDEAGEVTGSYFPVDASNLVLDKRIFEFDYKNLLSGSLSICSVSCMMKRSHFLKLKGYNETLFFEDLDYWLRLSYQYIIVFLDEFLVEKRELKNSLGNLFYKKNDFTKKIDASFRTIYKQAMERNNKEENRCLLKRIHYSMEQSYLLKKWHELFRLSLLELECRWKIYFV